MKILLVDRSGRGHAFADLFSRTDENAFVHYAPGCPAVTTPRVVSRPELALSDPAPMVRFASAEGVDLVFVANTMALADGFVDAFRSAGLPVIGPDRAASRLESSKIYSKGLFARYGIPSPRYAAFSEPEEARAWVRQAEHQVVVKADGLCGGNGAFVCDDEGEALAAIDRLMVQRIFGEAGSRIVVEERLHGREVSFFVLLDGEGYLMLPMALDYPKSDDGNRGVVSAGMGALSPHPLETAPLIEKVEKKILHPLLRLIAAERLRYNGVIYLGCMLAGEEPYLLEINARMGDPEAEVVLPRIESDFGEICRALLAQRLSQCSLRLNDLCCCDVVATQGPTHASGNGGPPEGYPGWPFGAFGRHYPITGLEAVDGSRCRVFLGEAAVLPPQGLVTDGGRAVHVVGLGRSTVEAVENAYANITHVRFEGIRYRGDIGRTMPWDD
jgi:phosphoribosylamine--glycine ligase